MSRARLTSLCIQVKERDLLRLNQCTPQIRQESWQPKPPRRERKLAAESTGTFRVNIKGNILQYGFNMYNSRRK